MIAQPLWAGGMPSIIGENCFYHIDSYNISSSAIGSAVWPSANAAIYAPIRVTKDIVIDALSVGNGAAVSGNFDIGIFDGVTKVKLVSTGSTGQAGTSTTQITAVTATTLKRGFYLLGLSFDNVTAQLNRRTLATAGAVNFSGYRMEAAAFALPATATPAISTLLYLPWMAIYTTHGH